MRRLTVAALLGLVSVGLSAYLRASADAWSRNLVSHPSPGLTITQHFDSDVRLGRGLSGSGWLFLLCLLASGNANRGFDANRNRDGHTRQSPTPGDRVTTRATATPWNNFQSSRLAMRAVRRLASGSFPERSRPPHI
jgi:hypothetical protein